MESKFRKYFATLKGKDGMIVKPIFYARNLEEAEKQAEEYIKKNYTIYWKMQIDCILDMGIA